MLQLTQPTETQPARATICWRLLSGPDPDQGPERLDHHQARLGPRPAGGPLLINELDASGLRGRGGAGFPVGRKWASVAAAERPARVVVVNVAEGEPASFKDRTLAVMRPHLILDGAALAAETIGARRVVLYVGREHDAARRALKHAVGERARARYREASVQIVEAPETYIAGESSAVVHRINRGDALPTLTPPSPREVGVDGLPTLINNAETMAHVALIARFGAGWFRQAGSDDSPGTVLLTVGGAVARPGVLEVDRAATIGDVVGAAGGLRSHLAGILLGGYFGTWLVPDHAWNMTLEDGSLKAHHTSLGCGVLLFLPAGACGVLESARLLRYLARQSAGQCGPCVFGLASIAESMERIAAGTGNPDDTRWLRRWAAQIAGRGACHHPDGAIRLLLSALSTFEHDIERHVTVGPCAGVSQPSILPGVGGNR